MMVLYILTLVLDDPNIVKALTLNIASSGYHMEEDNKPFTLIYRIYYRLLGTQLNPGAKINREPSSKTMLIQASFGRREWNGMERNEKNHFRIFFLSIVWEF